MGIAAVTAWEVEDIRLARPGDVFPLGDYEVHFDGVERLPLGADFAAVNCGTTMESVVKGGERRNFETIFGRFRLVKGGEDVAHLCPEKRVYPVQSMPTTEAAIDSGPVRDVYLVLGDQNEEGAWTVRSYLKPLAAWIWLGALVMGLGGLVSLTDRRFRVGAAARRAAAVPAE
jgi:cytochrome c-type biogenesis protein CcmF